MRRARRAAMGSNDAARECSSEWQALELHRNGLGVSPMPPRSRMVDEGPAGLTAPTRPALPAGPAGAAEARAAARPATAWRARRKALPSKPRAEATIAPPAAAT